MKKIARISLSILITVFLYSSLFSQISDPYFIIQKTNNKILTKNVNGEKTMLFDIAGFASKEQADSLVSIIKTLRGVVSATIDETSTGGTWKTTVVFYKYATKMYFKDFFSWCGIKKVVIDNITYDTQSFEMVE